jgi:polar amino acid transport system substrate-binding protein
MYRELVRIAMKSNAMKFLVAIFACLLCMPMAWAADSSSAVDFFTDKEKEGGFLVEITRESFQRVGYTVNIHYVPWARALQSVMAGHGEALLGAQYNPERALKMQYTDLVGRSEMVFFKLKSSNIAYSRLEDLRGATVGTIVDSAYTPEFDAAKFILKDPVSDYDVNIKKLLLGRVSLILEKKTIVLKTLAIRYPLSADSVVMLDKPLKIDLFYNAFSKSFPGYEKKISDFNRGLNLITKDGTLKKIMEKNLHE